MWLVGGQQHRIQHVNVADAPFAGHGELADYLKEEVLSTLPGQLNRFLLTIAPLGCFNVDLCDAVINALMSSPSSSIATPVYDSADCIAELVRRNLFIDTMDERSGWFTLHPLFVELLLMQGKPEAQQIVHQCGFDWLRQHGYRIEALTQAKLGNLGQEVSQWLEEEADSILSDLDVGRSIGLV